MKIVLTETNDFFNCCQSFNPAFRNMPLQEIENQEQENLKSYANVGYNSFLLNRALGTIYIQNIKAKTLEDIFNSDMYGLLR